MQQLILRSVVATALSGFTLTAGLAQGMKFPGMKIPGETTKKQDHNTERMLFQCG